MPGAYQATERTENVERLLAIASALKIPMTTEPLERHNGNSHRIPVTRRRRPSLDTYERTREFGGQN